MWCGPAGWSARGVDSSRAASRTTASPSATAVGAAFFAIAHAAEGADAVHCQGGLGRTGTLVALFLVRLQRFSPGAWEVMGWLRIVLPGSVVCDSEQRHWSGGRPRGKR